MEAERKTKVGCCGFVVSQQEYFQLVCFGGEDVFWDFGVLGYILWFCDLVIFIFDHG